MGQQIVCASWGAHGRGAEIAYGIVDSPFGRMLIAVTRRGICALSFHQSDRWQVRELRRDFREAKIRHDLSAVRPAAEAVLRYLRGESDECDVPLDVRGTPFQLKVWKELRAIRLGATRSYAEIAARLGSRSSARAVGHAIGANAVSVLIPCHRALGSDGSLTGYRWGLGMKRKLLDFERERAGLGTQSREQSARRSSASPRTRISDARDTRAGRRGKRI